MNKPIQQSENSVVLYGVSRVEYGPDGCTPFPMCLKSCANYLGQDIGINHTMVSTGAAFRLTWDTTSWNGGNVDVMHTLDNPEKVCRLGVEALGREFSIITRAKNHTDIKFNNCPKTDNKEDFKSFIRERIDKGFPCIALGIIGPAEACIITGYRDNGDTLLGWNFFQDAVEFASHVTFDQSGYFITNQWWENDSTVAVISMSEIVTQPISTRKILENAISVMTGRTDKNAGKVFAKGISAYDAWKQAIINEADFAPNAILPILVERLMCQGDAMDCLADGRYNAAEFMKKTAVELPQCADLCKCAGENFMKVSQNIWKMAELLGGYAREEKQIFNFAKPEVRKQIAVLIDECKAADNKALDAIKSIVESTAQ